MAPTDRPTLKSLMANLDSTQAYVDFLDLEHKTLAFCAIGRVGAEAWDAIAESFSDVGREAVEITGIPGDRTLVERISTEISITNSVSHTSGYMANIFASIIVAYPQRFGNESIPLSLGLSVGSAEELAQAFAFRKADELTYGGLAAMLKFLEKDLGVKVDIDPDLRQRATVAVAVRNVIAHAGGIINQRFLLETKWTDKRVGERLTWNTTEALSWSRAVRELVELIDSAVIKTFGEKFITADRARNTNNVPAALALEFPTPTPLEKAHLDKGSSGDKT